MLSATFKPFLLSVVIMLSVVMLYVIMLTVSMLSVVAPANLAIIIRVVVFEPPKQIFTSRNAQSCN